ncbi:hypothetical protein [Capnocytophaga canimorsus]|uniref:hypothetical protein n=1 Tax=Capnocytophaga canimorsus TaxID=28188 RepID=UPI0028EC183C|nr:hypothetical protein [Capnocytophaga canimorsus]MDT9499521.1 hypothetical protein [Capnocytophaga canimorsus]
MNDRYSYNILNPESKNISDRELLKNIYYHLLAIHIKIDKLGMLKYKEMGVEEPERFVNVLNDDIARSIYPNDERMFEMDSTISEFIDDLTHKYFNSED